MEVATELTISVGLLYRWKAEFEQAAKTVQTFKMKTLGSLLGV
jgi:hypothetical protein